MIAFLRESGGGVDVSVPPTIQALLAARLDRLTLPERRTIGAASVIGPRVLGGGGRPRWPATATRRTLLDTLTRKQLVAPDPIRLRGRDRLRLQPHPGPRRRLRVDHQGGPRRAARAPRGLARAAPPRAHDRARGDPRPSPRARLPLPLRPRRCRRALVRARAARRAAGLRPPGARAVRAREDTAAVGLLGARRVAAAGDRRARGSSCCRRSASRSRAPRTTRRPARSTRRRSSVRSSAGERRVEGLARLGRAHVWFVAHPEVTATRIVDGGRARDPPARAHGRASADSPTPGGCSARRACTRAARATASGRSSRRSSMRTRRRCRGTWNAISFAMGMCLLDGPAHLERATAFRRRAPGRGPRSESMRAMEADMLHVLGVGLGRRGRFDEARDGARGVDRDQRGHGAALHVAVVQAQPRPPRAGSRRPGRGRARPARELGRADGDGPAQLARRDRRAAGRGALRPGPQRRGGGDAARREGRMGGRRRQRQRAPALGARAVARGRGLDASSRRRPPTARCGSCATRTGCASRSTRCSPTRT